MLNKSKFFLVFFVLNSYCFSSSAMKLEKVKSRMKQDYSSCFFGTTRKNSKKYKVSKEKEENDAVKKYYETFNATNDTIVSDMGTTGGTNILESKENSLNMKGKKRTSKISDLIEQCDKKLKTINDAVEEYDKFYGNGKGFIKMMSNLISVLPKQEQKIVNLFFDLIERNRSDKKEILERNGISNKKENIQNILEWDGISDKKEYIQNILKLIPYIQIDCDFIAGLNQIIIDKNIKNISADELCLNALSGL